MSVSTEVAEYGATMGSLLSGHDRFSSQDDVEKSIQLLEQELQVRE